MRKNSLLYGSLLAALLAEGADLTRPELERKLKDLADSPAPTQLSPGATCYKMAMPRLIRYRYVCPECGEVTCYHIGHYGSCFALAESAAKAVPELRKLDLDIRLDMRAFCSRCAPDKRFFEPVIETVESKDRGFRCWNVPWAKDEVRLPRGSRLELEWRSGFDGWVRIPEQWVPSKFIVDGKILDWCNVRCGPGETFPSLALPPPGTPVEVVPRHPGDPEEWTRIRIDRLVERISKDDSSLPKFPEAVWVVKADGVEWRTPLEENDVALLTAFLTGKDRVKLGQDRELPLKSYLPRLRKLLGKESQ